MADWKEALKKSALEAVDNIARETQGEAKKLLADLERAGHTVTLKPEQDGLLVSPRPSPELSDRIKRLRDDLMDVLKQAPEIWRWKPEDVSVQVSLCKSSVVDFVLAPPVDGVSHTPILPRIQTILLAGASTEWKARVKKLGGLVAYSPSQWPAARIILQEKLGRSADKPSLNLQPETTGAPT